MTGSVQELENRISRLLPEKPTVQANPEIQELTRQLIDAGKDAWDTIGYTHSVCHMFEKYGHGSSYLNSPELLPIASELVDFTLRKAMNERDFGCVSRIVQPVANLNLAHLEESPEIIVFRPSIMTDENFIENYARSGDVQYSPFLVDFCKAGNIGEYFVKYAQALRKLEGLDELTDTEVVPGVFIDVDNTLIFSQWNNAREKVDYSRMPLTQEYALRKLEEGSPITIFTGREPEKAIQNLMAAGVDRRLCAVQPKGRYIGRTLEICIDDSNPIIQGFRAKKYYSSGRDAIAAEYPGWTPKEEIVEVKEEVKPEQIVEPVRTIEAIVKEEAIIEQPVVPQESKRKTLWQRIFGGSK